MKSEAVILQMVNRKTKRIFNSIVVTIHGVPTSWKKRNCRIDGDESSHQHKPTWGKFGEETTWYCQRCGQKLEQPLG